ncbi:MAG: transporter substrate-binding domain-containing protein [Bacteroidota bacterium]|nr:transporter substrate-binding domain-containing protein [Bacteroidota bacterium]
MIISLLVFSCKNGKDIESATKSDLIRVRERGKIIAVTSESSINYFLYKGEPMGFQYELLKQFADYLGVKLEIKTCQNAQEQIELLKNGDCDLIADNLFQSKELFKEIDFSHQLYRSRLVIVQRNNSKPDNLKKSEYIRFPLKLGGKSIYVQKNSPDAGILRQLSGKFSDSIKVLEVEKNEDYLIRMVSEGYIDYTVCDQQIAKVFCGNLKNLDYRLTVSSRKPISWGVAKESKDLLYKLNEWLDNTQKSGQVAILFQKYFQNEKTEKISKSTLYTLTSGRVSVYDELIKEQSQKLKWDWRLLASLIYQESHFKHNVKSYAGAHGIMQLMPLTAEYYGVERNAGVGKNIKGGVKFLNYLDRQLLHRTANKEERIKFVLAAYNIGLGHVLDARRLARKHGKNPGIWDKNVRSFLIKESHSSYYKDPVVLFGYCNGLSACNYVDQVLERYHHYLNITNND